MSLTIHKKPRDMMHLMFKISKYIWIDPNVTQMVDLEDKFLKKLKEPLLLYQSI